MMTDQAKSQEKLNREFIRASYKDEPSEVLRLISLGAEVNTTSGDSALMLAALWGKSANVSALLTVPGIEINYVNEQGSSALNIAIVYHHFDIALALIAASNINVNLTKKERVTLLMEASFSGNLDVVNALLKAGANPNAVSDVGCTAIAMATANGCTDIIAALEKAGAHALNTTHSYEGNIALCIAASAGKKAMVEHLLENQLIREQINWAPVSRPEDTAIMAAFDEDHDDIVSLLERHGAILPERLRPKPVGFSPDMPQIKNDIKQPRAMLSAEITPIRESSNRPCRFKGSYKG
jgi:ankyrin repeat protein